MNLKNEIFDINGEDEFNKRALSIFNFQYEKVSIYKSYVDHKKIDPKSINHYTEIPCLPIRFFKSNNIIAKDKKEKITFLSSGTTNQARSKHLVHDVDLYQKSFLKTFEQNYGNVEDCIILALLPSYQEQGNSSLIYMADELIKNSGHQLSGYLSINNEETVDKINKLKDQKVILIGVSYALLDLAENVELPPLSSWIIMETGGMKGRKKEMVRDELHLILRKKYQCENIHSEYGMTELLSQAYAKTNGEFYSPSWMKILIRELEDPLSYNSFGKTGGVNIIDLANIYSCSFIETQDLGRVNENSSFNILGRYDQAEVRGCNLLSFN